MLLIKFLLEYVIFFLTADDKPDLADLQYMSYTGDDGKEIHFRLMDQLKPHWRRLAIALKFPQHEIATMESKGDPVYYLLTEWLRGANKAEDPRPASWRTLIEALQHANVQEVVTVLEERLIIRNIKKYKAASHSDFSTVKSKNRLDTKYMHHPRVVSSSGHGPENEFSDPVETAFPPPSKPYASNVTHNSITLQWSKSDRGTSIVQYYTILYRNYADDRERWTTFQTYNARQNATLSDLDPETAYVFKLRAESAAGPSPDSELSDPIRTLVPVSQPGKPFATKVTHDSVTLKWERPKQGAQNLKHYQVIYFSAGDSDNIASHTAKKEEITLLRLDPENAYIFKVKAENVAGSISESELSDPIKTLFSPPGKPYATNITYQGFRVNWQKPSYGPILYYSVSYQATDDPSDKWHTQETNGDITYFSFTETKGKFYVFKVAAVTSAGVSSDSELSDPIETKAEPWGVKISRGLQPIPNSTSNPPTYLLPTHCVTKTDNIVKVHVGANSQNKTKKGDHTSCSCHTRTVTVGFRHKVLMMVGATGAGKTTLINRMANYILGVQWDDDFRFKLIAESASQDKSKSQIACITAYTFYKESGSNLPYTLTVIDTPGFGDIDGGRHVVSQIKKLFSTAGDEGIHQLHGIGFVTQAPLAQLTPTQQYVFDAIPFVFGRDVANNIFLMITFADGMKPPVLDAVQAANMLYQAFFKFNSSALFASKSADDEFDKMVWKKGTKSFDEFFKQFSSAQTQSLQLSRQVIHEHETLEVTIQGLQPQIQLGLSKINELRQERQILKDHKADVLTNQVFTYKVEVTKQREINLPSRTYTTNCCTCDYTCHDDCKYNDDDDKFRCSAMCSGRGTLSATCGICPQKCSWKEHKNNPYRFELYQDYETRTSDELKTRYKLAMSSKEQLEGVLEDIKKELDTMNMAVFRKIEQVRRSVNRLQEIALKPNYLTEVEYIDLLIETEKHEAKPHWMGRVQALESVRHQAVIVAKLMKNPQAQQQDVFSFEETQLETSMWQKLLHEAGAN